MKTFWESNIKGKWPETNGDCESRILDPSCVSSLMSSLIDVFDFLLTRDLSRGHIIDFNPYAPRTDPLLFTYEDLHDLLLARGDDYSPQPELRVVDSPSHPAATRNAPAHQHNMVPLEALTISSGRNMEDFAGALQEEIRKSMQDDSDED